MRSVILQKSVSRNNLLLYLLAAGKVLLTYRYCIRDYESIILAVIVYTGFCKRRFFCLRAYILGKSAKTE